MKTPITYYGGKQNMLRHILPRIPQHRIYTEAFFGGGAVFFAKEPSVSETINDASGMVVNFYRVLKTDFAKLKEKIGATPFSRDAFVVAHCMYRKPHLFGRVQRAWAFHYLTNCGFAGKIGSWGYDRLGARAKAFSNKKALFDASIGQRLEKVQIENNDALRVIGSRDAADAFHYVDPPYVNTDQGHYPGYTEADFERLLGTLSRVKGKFLLSSYPSDTLCAYVKKHGWHSLAFSKKLSASKGKQGEARGKKTEVLTANYPI